MKTVIFIDNDSLGSIFDQPIIQVIIFSLGNGKVIDVKNGNIISNGINYISLWCLSECINEIYIKDITPDERNFFQRLGIKTKTLKELENDCLYNTLILRG
jgi:hypothetical protein